MPEQGVDVRQSKEWMCARSRSGCAPEQRLDVRQSMEWMCARARSGCVSEQGVDVHQSVRWMCARAKVGRAPEQGIDVSLDQDVSLKYLYELCARDNIDFFENNKLLMECGQYVNVALHYVLFWLALHFQELVVDVSDLTASNRSCHRAG